MKKGQIILLTAVTVVAFVVGCKEYTDDLTDIGRRVEILEKEAVESLSEQLELLKQLVEVAEGLNYITEIRENEDGTYTLFFANHPERPWSISNGTIGEKGQKGETGKAGTIGVIQGSDGVWYWEIDGRPTTIPVMGEDGKGLTVNDVPLIKIDSSTGYWVYSLDRGKTWTLIRDSDNNQPVAAKGDPGDEDKIFANVEVIYDAYGVSIGIRFTLQTGEVFEFYKDGQGHEGKS